MSHQSVHSPSLCSPNAFKEFKERRSCSKSIRLTMFLGATLLVMSVGTLGAEPLPVVGPPFGVCRTVGPGCLNGGALSVSITFNNCISFFNRSTLAPCQLLQN